MSDSLIADNLQAAREVRSVPGTDVGPMLSLFNTRRLSRIEKFASTVTPGVTILMISCVATMKDREKTKARPDRQPRLAKDNRNALRPQRDDGQTEHGVWRVEFRTGQQTSPGALTWL